MDRCVHQQTSFDLGWQRKILVALHLLYLIPLMWVSLALRQLLRKSRLSFKDDLTRSLIRNVYVALPPQLIRVVSAMPMDRVLVSQRFSKVHANLLQEVCQHDFHGYWICQSTFEKPQDPSTSDITILFLHGGGYCTGDIGLYVVLLLMIAETVRRSGKTISIFHVEYPLSPEQRFPAALLAVTAAYKYLIQETRVNPSKLVFMGDSAGGNLALSLLKHLQSPLPDHFYKTSSTIDRNVMAKLPKSIAAVVLISPWLSLNSAHATISSNKDTDILSKSMLDDAASCYRSVAAVDDRKTAIQYTEFADLTAGRGWDWLGKSCSKILIYGGADEVFIGDIVDFAKHAAEVGKLDIRSNIAVGKEHDWQLIEAIDAEKLFLGTESSKGEAPGIVPFGATEIGDAIAQIV